VIFANCRVVENAQGGGAAGTLDKNLHVVCASGAIELLKVKPAGSGLMDFKAFVNGRACSEGDFFMPIEKLVIRE